MKSPPFTALELAILAPPERLTVREWAERHLLVTEGPLVGRERVALRWSADAFPPQRSWVNAVDDGRWAATLFMGAPQATGKTEAIAKPIILHAVDHRQVNAFYVAGNADLANTQWGKRFEPAIRQNPALLGLLFANTDFGGNRLERKFTNGCSLFVCGSESIGNLSAKTGPVIICDDVQSYGTIPGFGSPADVAAARTGAYPAEDRTVVYIGTAGTVDDWLYRTLSASAFFMPFVPCLACGTFQLIEFERFVYNAENIAETKADTYMKCASPACDHRITFAELPEMLGRHAYVSPPPGTDWVLQPMEGGTWVDLAQSDVYPETHRNTNVGGFWCGSALYWPFGLTWGEHAAEFISRSGDPERVRDWKQQTLNRPFKADEIDEERLTEEEITGHARGYEARTIPNVADVLLVTVDVQSGYVYYLVRAWQSATGNSWLIDLGTFGRPIRGASELSIEERRKLLISASLNELDGHVLTSWPIVDEAGKELGRGKALAGLVDIGFERDIVAAWWCAKHRGVWHLIAGQRSGIRGSMWPPEPKTTKRGVPYREVDVSQAKHVLRTLQRIPHGEPGYQALPDRGLAANTVRAYSRHMTSERFDRSRLPPRWVKIAPGVANHFYDCEVYQVSLAIAAGVRIPTLIAPAVQADSSVGYQSRENKEHGGSWKIGR